jgi:hypothetical protein
MQDLIICSRAGSSQQTYMGGADALLIIFSKPCLIKAILQSI